MAKLGTFFLILGAIQLALLLYVGGTETSAQLWQFWTHPTNFSTTDWILSLLTVAATVGLVAAITVGTVFGFKTDFIIFAPAIAGLLAMLVIALQLYTQIQKELVVPFGCIDVSHACPTVDWILWATISPLIFYYAWTVIEWWRGKDM